MTWEKVLKYDPVKALITSGHENIKYFAKRDLLGRGPGPVEDLWKTEEVKRLLKKQYPSGYWKYPGKRKEERFPEDYLQIETYRNLGFLVEKFGIDRRCPALSNAAEFLLGCQTEKGDLRGIYGNQYSPNYSAAILELLIKAGYESDTRVIKGLEWLLSLRQQDGGWAIPLRTAGNIKYSDAVGGETIEPDRSKPFSHLVTGIVLRAFSSHHKYRNHKEIIKAGKLIASRMFKKDKYPDREKEEYWERFSYPFWWTDLLSALDSLSRLGLNKSETEITGALEWFIERQKPDGLWELKLLRDRYKDQKYWIALAICRVLKRFYS
jgi:hypothetical protein